VSDYRIVTGRRKQLEERIAELEKKIEYLCRDQENYEPILVAENQRLKDRIEELEADVYAQALAKHHALDTVRSWETKYEELEATIKRIEAKLPNWERKPMSDWESIYIGPQQGRNECAMVIRAILKQRDKDDE